MVSVVTSVIFVYKALHRALYHVLFQNKSELNNTKTRHTCHWNSIISPEYAILQFLSSAPFVYKNHIVWEHNAVHFVISTPYENNIYV